MKADSRNTSILGERDAIGPVVFDEFCDASFEVFEDRHSLFCLIRMGRVRNAKVKGKDTQVEQKRTGESVLDAGLGWGLAIVSRSGGEWKLGSI